MSKFNYQKHEIFGKYCKIPMNANGEKHIFKCIGVLQSNTYMDMPFFPYHEMTMHDNIVDVANVIHCGIDETEVIRVAMKEIEIIDDNPPLKFDDLKPGMWVWDDEHSFYDQIISLEESTIETETWYTPFEENRFYRKQKEN